MLIIELGEQYLEALKFLPLILAFISGSLLWRYNDDLLCSFLLHLFIVILR